MKSAPTASKTMSVRGVVREGVTVGDEGDGTRGRDHVHTSGISNDGDIRLEDHANGGKDYVGQSEVFDDSSAGGKDQHRAGNKDDARTLAESATMVAAET